MANITNYLRSRILNQSVGNAPLLWHEQTYIGLFVASPDENYLPDSTGSAVEVAGTTNGYDRIEILSSDWTELNEFGQIANVNPITWTANGTWSGTLGGAVAQAVVGTGLFDASSAGNLLWFGPLSVPVTIVSEDTFTIAPGSLVLTLA